MSSNCWSLVCDSCMGSRRQRGHLHMFLPAPQACARCGKRFVPRPSLCGGMRAYGNAWPTEALHLLDEHGDGTGWTP